jgi:3-deoxy-alpha-D-manno-octulosonate 8-oxidase
MYKNFKLVDKVVYGKGSFNQLGQIVSEKKSKSSDWIAYLVDDVFREKPLAERIPLEDGDMVIWINVDSEPTTEYIDNLVSQIKKMRKEIPAGIVGIGGGSTMDIAKAVSLMLTNEGSAADYQGWDLIKNPSVYHVGVPTLSGTGAEVSRTTVLTGPVKKLGINSDFTVFNQIVLDPELIADAPKEQRFYTAMDCYIHNAEALTGNYKNAFSIAYGEKSQELCREVFLGDLARPEADEKLMMASMFGGFSIAYSQVGVCHALSYGISYILKLRHGLSNCVVFNQLEEYYPEYVEEFREIMHRHKIELPQNLTAECSDDDIQKMIDVSMVLEPLWDHALGANWREIMTREKMEKLFRKM